MEKFFATIFTIILVAWALKWLLVIIGPWLLRLFAKRMMRKAGFGTGDTASAGKNADRAEGGKTETVKSGKWWKTEEVILKPSRRHGERISDILGGEYIDYETVETESQSR